MALKYGGSGSIASSSLPQIIAYGKRNNDTREALGIPTKRRTYSSNTRIR